MRCVDEQHKIGLAVDRAQVVRDYYQGVDACIVFIVNLDLLWTIPKENRPKLIRALNIKKIFTALKTTRIMFSVCVDNINSFDDKWIAVETDEEFPERGTLEKEMNNFVREELDYIKKNN